jgi:hypothetical protein
MVSTNRSSCCRPAPPLVDGFHSSTFAIAIAGWGVGTLDEPAATALLALLVALLVALLL